MKLFQAIRPFERAAALRDGLAGFTLASMNIPQALGYTKIAGMPVVTGLYTLLLPLVAFATFGSSRYLVVSADSATAAIFAGGVSDLAPAASVRYVALAGTVALLTAGFLFLARLLRLGFIADFLSETVLAGFLTGVGCQVGIAVLGEMLGVPVSAHRTIPQLAEVCGRLPDVHPPTLAVSVFVVGALLLLQRFAPRVPAALIAVVGAVAASAIWNFNEHGIAIIGPVAGGLPHFGYPAVSWRDIPPLIPIAASCCIMIVTQSAATARVYAARHQQHLDANADLVGLCAANAMAGLSGTFVVNGSPTQTALVESAGAQSQIPQLATAVSVALVLLFLTKPLQYLPHCVLGALVFMIAIRLIKLRALLTIRRQSPGEFALALTTAVVVVAVGVEQGILLAMVLSLFRIVQHSYHPHTGVMVLNDDGTWNLNPLAPGAVTKPGLVMYRFGAALFYANANRFAEEVNCLVGQPPSQVRWLIVDAEAITRLDYSAAHVVRELQQNLMNCGTELGFARMSGDLRADFARHHLIEVIAPSRLFNRLHDALAAFERRRSS
ncbi:SulP family inorganic anion transporter [Alloacidobacterium dinghuense]|uniref:SulP family inorganic anion transporter n=1 Tax=Alloacidobacterium dinghuense TaxID=2763107 RepID=UPI0025563438|nr:SulP family inorganic anion transporter [Alloacidobacterium dinghuense]